MIALLQSVFVNDVQAIERGKSNTRVDEPVVRRACISQVRLQLFEDCLVPFTQSAYKAMLLKKAMGIIKNRKLRVLLGFLGHSASEMSNVQFVDKLVQSRAEIEKEIAKYDDPRVTVELLDLADIEAILASFTILLASNGVTVEKRTSGNYVPEVVLMIPCSLQLENWAIQASAHATP